jgi:predicted transcriptional regulator
VEFGTGKMAVAGGRYYHRLAAGSHVEAAEVAVASAAAADVAAAVAVAVAVAAVVESFANVGLVHYTPGMKLESYIAEVHKLEQMVGLAQELLVWIERVALARLVRRLATT